MATAVRPSVLSMEADAFATFALSRGTAMFLALHFFWAAIWPDFFFVLVANTAAVLTTPLISTINTFMANLMSWWFITIS